jgi:hypothetical protein
MSRRSTTFRSDRVAATVVALCIALLGAGCGDDDPSEVASPSTTSTSAAASATTTTSTAAEATTSSTTSTTPTSTTPTTATGGTSGATPEEQEVIDRYVGYWEARAAANSGVPDPASPALVEFATGEQLDAVVAETQANLDGGLAFRPADDPANYREVRVVSIAGDQAVVQECRVDDGVVFRRDTGEVVNAAVATHNVRGELQRVDGVWKVARAELVQRWEGVGGCAVVG